MVMWRYRYRREYLGDDDLVDRCNALGEDGWSLVGAPAWVPGDPALETAGCWRCFFKRTVSNREQIAEVFALHPRPGARDDGGEDAER
jgi:hypothetical protein